MARKRKAHEAVDDDEIEFKIVAPAIRNKTTEQKDLHWRTDNPADSSLSMEYTIEPGKRWESFVDYKRMKYIGLEFKVGDFVYVNRRSPPPAQPPLDSTDAQVLDYNKENMWVGRIQEFKAEKGKNDKVLIRVFWMYWPEELPDGRHDYHGAFEVVLSNHADIIEAQSVSGPAEVAHWDESDTMEAPTEGLYYRSTLNFATGRKRPVSSRSQQHCQCHKPYNPDRDMYHCSSSTCATWNHESCLGNRLVADITREAAKGNMLHYLDTRAAEWKKECSKKSIGGALLAAGGTIVASVEHTVRSVMHQIEDGQGGPDTNGNSINDDDDKHVSFIAEPARTPSPSGLKNSSLNSPPATPSSPLTSIMKSPTQQKTPKPSIVIEIPAPSSKTKKTGKQVQTGKLRINIQQDDANNTIAVVTLPEEDTPASSSKVNGSAGRSKAGQVHEWRFVLECLMCRRKLD